MSETPSPYPDILLVAGGSDQDELLERLRTLLAEHEAKRGAGPGGRADDRPLDRELLVKSVVRLQRQHQLRTRFVDPSVSAEPAWPMLLELFRSALTDSALSTKQLSCASAAPPTTALRWIASLVENGYAERHSSSSDGRLALLRITKRGFEEVRRYLAHLGSQGLS